MVVFPSLYVVLAQEIEMEVEGRYAGRWIKVTITLLHLIDEWVVDLEVPSILQVPDALHMSLALFLGLLPRQQPAVDYVHEMLGLPVVTQQGMVEDTKQLVALGLHMPFCVQWAVGIQGSMLREDGWHEACGGTVIGAARGDDFVVPAVYSGCV
eukprot:CAMPEP_0202863634 /NCGR_PEP_ID=MMETSP1391-20130828/4193_1 /ASSEMBLY_ACC=CAM_ASM_000867 /TAXON_ID=1034604 /ORGANISM="Chlamydomonas leiostraca, Strain SAG 11-49" /LENGTH=153 /DNA_ID=CAMNT_0049543291 /DNA_START=371 /DNA_END=834 /DNA_ORIENTATION=+